MKKTESIQSQGGKARAKKLTPEQRKAIASKAADARWSIPQSTHEGPLELGGVTIDCAVLEDGTRILSRASFVRAIGRQGKVKGGAAYQPESQLPVFLGADNLKDFINNDLRKNSKPLDFRMKSGNRAIGYKAEILPEVCEVFLNARQADALKSNQKHIANQCEILMRGLAKVGITALVDEATGFQYDRAKDALAVILEKFISKELRLWTKTFPVEFYEEIFRLNGWGFDPNSVKRPGVIGTWTNDIVYKRLAPGVLIELKKKTPKTPSGNRRHRYFQWLSGDIGHPKLLAHIEGVKILMKISKTWEDFKEKLDEHYPIIETTELGLEVQVKSK